MAGAPLAAGTQNVQGQWAGGLRRSTPVLGPGASYGQRSLQGTVRGVAESWTRLSN